MSEPQRLHPAAILILAIRVSRQLVLPLLLPVILDIFRRGFGGLDIRVVIFAGTMLSLLVVVSAVWGFLFWQRYVFRVASNELQIEQGIIFRKRRTIPRERIQAIDFVEGVLHRVFGLVQVRVQTAGGVGPGISLIGISRADAERLRRELSIRPGEVARDESAEGELAGETTPEPIRALSIPQLLLAATTSGGIGIALPVIASGMSILNNAMQDVNLFEEAARLVGGTGWFAVGIFILLAAWVLSLTGTILAHWGFTLRRVDDNLLIERGLIERRRATVPLNRIQSIRVVEGLLRQPFGYAMVRVESAGYGQEAGESSVLFPMIRMSEIPGFLEETVPEFAQAFPELRRPPRRAARRYITRMVMVGAGISAFAILLLYPLGLYALVTLPIFGLWGWLSYRDAGWAVHGETLLLRSRTLARSTAIVPKRRIQFSDVSQTILQRRARLGNISVTVASGASGASFSVMHLDKTIADQLFAWTGRDRTRLDRSRLPRQLAPGGDAQPEGG